jgi:hypothetical protein
MFPGFFRAMKPEHLAGKLPQMQNGRSGHERPSHASGNATATWFRRRSRARGGTDR